MGTASDFSWRYSLTCSKLDVRPGRAILSKSMSTKPNFRWRVWSDRDDDQTLEPNTLYMTAGLSNSQTLFKEKQNELPIQPSPQQGRQKILPLAHPRPLPRIPIPVNQPPTRLLPRRVTHNNPPSHRQTCPTMRRACLRKCAQLQSHNTTPSICNQKASPRISLIRVGLRSL